MEQKIKTASKSQFMFLMGCAVTTAANDHYNGNLDVRGYFIYKDKTTKDQMENIEFYDVTSDDISALFDEMRSKHVFEFDCEIYESDDEEAFTTDCGVMFRDGKLFGYGF